MHFTNSNIFLLTPSKSSKDMIISLSKSYQKTFINIKTVVFSYSYSLLKIDYECSNYEGIMTICQTGSYVPKFLPYIIYSYSLTYIETILLNEIFLTHPKLTNEQLIGIVCGSVAIFFLILGIIFLDINRKPKFEEFDDFEESIDQSIDEEYHHEKDEMLYNNIPSKIDTDWI